MPDDPEAGNGSESDAADTLRSLAQRKSERLLLDVVTWLEMKSEVICSPSLCGLIALHYDVLAEHREVVSRTEMVAQYRRRAAHWRMRAAAYVRCAKQTGTGHAPLERREPAIDDRLNNKRFQEDLI